ncbi:hypothetical protein K438DRAFT_1752723 [Mycena galopus ATCC 62051]|nr:hypothetical protein K438DRAFT_1752723 [Mycena galopus ATCC 62051]
MYLLFAFQRDRALDGGWTVHSGRCCSEQTDGRLGWMDGWINEVAISIVLSHLLLFFTAAHNKTGHSELLNHSGLDSLDRTNTNASSYDHDKTKFEFHPHAFWYPISVPPPRTRNRKNIL